MYESASILTASWSLIVNQGRTNTSLQSQLPEWDEMQCKNINRLALDILQIVYVYDLEGTAPGSCHHKYFLIIGLK